MKHQENVVSNTNNFPSQLAPLAPTLISESSSSWTECPAVPASKKPARPANFLFKKLLYPIKNFPQDSNQIEANATRVDENILPQSEWTCLDPLEMVQRVVMLAGESSGFNDELRRVSSLSPFFPNREVISCSGPIKKRKSEHIVGQGYCSDDGVDDRIVEALIESYRNFVQVQGSVSNEWDNLTKKYPSLGGLVEDFERILEADPKKTWCIPSYNRVQKAFVLRVSSADADQNTVDLALKSAQQQMQALIFTASNKEPTGKSPVASYWAFKPKRCAHPVQPVHRAYNLRSPKDRKDTFNSCMVVWMRHNFANPFPDDVMLRRLANYMIQGLGCHPALPEHQKDSMNPAEHYNKTEKITMDKITNWLVNSRTRKWRPSIEKAFDAKRPAMLLLEDSIALFEGKKLLRPVKTWNQEALFGFDPIYSAPLITRKKKKKDGEPKPSNSGDKKKPAATLPFQIHFTPR